jgi:hypothetical protein
MQSTCREDVTLVNKESAEAEEKSCRIGEAIGSLCQVFVLKTTGVKREQPGASSYVMTIAFTRLYNDCIYLNGQLI